MGDLQRKEEEMRQMFVNKVKETEAELKEKEREVGLKCSYGYRCRIHTLNYKPQNIKMCDFHLLRFS